MLLEGAVGFLLMKVELQWQFGDVDIRGLMAERGEVASVDEDFCDRPAPVGVVFEMMVWLEKESEGELRLFFFFRFYSICCLGEVRESSVKVFTSSFFFVGSCSLGCVWFVGI